MALSTDFAFEGFRIIRERPILILYWGIFSLIVMGLGQLLLTQQFASALDEFERISDSVAPGSDPTPLFAALGGVLPYYLILIAVSLVFSAILNCAVYRAVYSEQSVGLGYIRLGGAELTQVLAHFLFFLIFLAFYIVVLLAAVIAGVIVAMVSQSVPVVGGIFVFLLVLAVICAVVWFAVRLSFFSIQTFDEKKLNLFGTWKLSKGNFWSLLAGYFIAFIMAMLVFVLFMLIFFGICVAIGQNPIDFFSRMTDASTSDLYADPLMIGYLAASSLVLSPLMTAILTGAPAAAYKALTARPETTF